MRTIVSLILALQLVTAATAQVDSFENAFNRQYEQNIRKERINGVYIPRDMDDAFVELERLSDKASVAHFREAEEVVVARKLHFGLGKWMVVNWNLYDGSRFSHYLRQMGITHPDDMVEFTIVSWHRHLNGRPLDLKERAKAFEEYRRGLSGVIDSLHQDSLRLHPFDTSK